MCRREHRVVLRLRPYASFQTPPRHVHIATRTARSSSTANLRARGVDVDQAVMHAGDPIAHWGGAALAGVPAMFLFRDPDGNSFLMVQQS